MSGHRACTSPVSTVGHILALWAQSLSCHMTHTLQILPHPSCPCQGHVAGALLSCAIPPSPFLSDQMEAHPSPGAGAPTPPTSSLHPETRVASRYTAPCTPPSPSPPLPPPHPLFKECQGPRWARRWVWKALFVNLFFFTSEIKKQNTMRGKGKREKKINKNITSLCKMRDFHAWLCGLVFFYLF